MTTCGFKSLDSDLDWVEKRYNRVVDEPRLNDEDEDQYRRMSHLDESKS